MDGASQPTAPPSPTAGRRAQRTAGVANHRGRLPHSLFGDPGEFTGDTAHRGLSLITVLLTAQLQLGGDRAGSLSGRAPPIL